MTEDPPGNAPTFESRSSIACCIENRLDSDTSSSSFHSAVSEVFPETPDSFRTPRISTEIALADPPANDGEAAPTNDVSTAQTPAEIAAPQPATAERGRLLDSYLSATRRPLDLERALSAVKLRCAAEVYCKKNQWARFAPRLPKSAAARRRFEALAVMSADDLIADVQANPKRYTRTLLTNLAQHHLLCALNIDVELYQKGIHKAGLYEGLHSVAGRLTALAAAGASAGVSLIPGTGHALKAGQKAVKIIAHELPPNIVNPALTGSLRSVTDVKEAFKRVGGQPVVAAQIEKSPDLATIVRSLEERRGELTRAIQRFREAARLGREHEALGPLVDSFLALHDVADRQYRRRIGLNRTQTYSKGWGMAVNGVAAVGTVVTAAVPVVGQIVGPAVLGAAVPLQWGAGYLDERRNKHRYAFRANTKWADFLSTDAARIHFKDLRCEHLSEAALRRVFITQPEVRIAAVREVYEDALGELLREHAELERKLGASDADDPTPDRTVMSHRARLSHLSAEIQRTKQHAADFESFDAARWAAIPEDSVIGRCLDDLKKLEKANRRARMRRPGESAQIVQRYVQAFHGGVSTGTALPIVDAIGAIDSSYALDDHGHHTHLHPSAEAGTIAAGVTGGAVFTAATGEVRMSKADNKKLLSQTLVDPERARTHEARWVFEAAGRRVDLSATAGYRRHVHSTWDELKLVGRAVRHGLVSGPVGLAHLVRAKWWPGGEHRQAKARLREALDALAQAGLARRPGAGAGRANTISAMKDELYDYEAVRLHLKVKV